MKKEMNYEIKNEYIKAKIKSFGAELNSLQKIDDSLEYIWQGDKEFWARHSPILFPIVGRLKNDSYFYKNQKYNMSQHGFARDKEFEIVESFRNDIIDRRALVQAGCWVLENHLDFSNQFTRFFP